MWLYMKISASSSQNAVPLSSPMKLSSLSEKKIASPGVVNLDWFQHILTATLYLNLVTAIVSFAFSVHHPYSSLLLNTGFIVVLASIALMLARCQIRKSNNWMEVCVMVLCCIYASFFVLWIAANNLMNIIFSAT